MSGFELFLIVVILIAGIAYVFYPVATEGDRGEALFVTDSETHVLEQEKTDLLVQIRELDFEYSKGTLAAEDYSTQREELIQKATDVYTTLDNIKPSKSRKTGKRSVRSPDVCPSCKAKIGADDRFCSQCGAGIR